MDWFQPTFPHAKKARAPLTVKKGSVLGITRPVCTKATWDKGCKRKESCMRMNFKNWFDIAKYF